MENSTERNKKVTVDCDGRKPIVLATDFFYADDRLCMVEVRSPVNYKRGLGYRTYTYGRGEGGAVVRLRKFKALARERRRGRRGE